MNMLYRPYRKTDREVIRRLIRQLYNEDFEGKPITDEKIDKTLSELLQHPEKGSVIVFESDNRIVGYSILICYWSNEFGGNILFIDELYILPEFRGREIGTGFIRYLKENRLYGSVALQLEVMPSNTAARRFYEKLGFKKSDRDTYSMEF